MTHPHTKSQPALSGSDTDYELAVAQARKICEASGARFTKIREHVYRALLTASQPVGAYDILETLEGVGAQKPPTVYRALDWLMEMGFAHRIATLSKFIAAPVSDESQPIAYLLCRECGKAETIDAAPLVASLDAAVKGTNFQKQDAIIEIFGLCVSHVSTTSV